MIEQAMGDCWFLFVFVGVFVLFFIWMVADIFYHVIKERGKQEECDRQDKERKETAERKLYKDVETLMAEREEKKDD